MRPAVPELFEIVTGVEHGGRVHQPGPALNADGHDLSVIATGTQVVAGGAGDRIVLGESRVVEQPPAECGFGLVHVGHDRERLDRLCRRSVFGKPEAERQTEAESPQRAVR